MTFINKREDRTTAISFTLVIDETGDRKKGTKTDYVARQYLGSIGKIDKGIVSVNAYRFGFSPPFCHKSCNLLALNYLSNNKSGKNIAVDC